MNTPSIARRRLGQLAGVLALSAAWPHAALAQAPNARMPSLKAANLNERVVTLPADLPGEKTLVLMAFLREQQPDVNTWIEGMKLLDSKLPWVEVPVVGAGGRLWQGLVNAGMRSGIREETMRERVITLFTDRLTLLRTMNLPGEGKVVLALVMNRSGDVLAQVQGQHSEDKAKLLLAAMQTP
jgi:hypothetical protein